MECKCIMVNNSFVDVIIIKTSDTISNNNAIEMAKQLLNEEL